ncbi:hypothetical protein [Halomonas sp. PGE1]|uniref:hypothetical protein n=1 Tax=Halomonas sp. PGE1 TaxID=2730360 RepID=UPI0014747161|nr:hypothetical protein [Halomonas sp. PGE1]QJQ99327.1 hypothetical protein HIR79_11900 [Halomonas sp. PGE1]
MSQNALATLNVFLQVRPLSTHPLTLPATLETRTIQDILGPQDLGSVSDDPTPQMLNHPPVILVHAESGEILLNRDAVIAQLQSSGDARAQVPNSLVVYALKSTTLDMSLRTLNFIYGQLQPLHYRKKDSNENSLADIAADTLKADRALYTAISQELFNRTSLELRHYRVLFAATNLAERSIRSLKNATSKKNFGNVKSTRPANKSTDNPLIMPTEIKEKIKHKIAEVPGSSSCDSPPKEASLSDATHSPGSLSPTIYTSTNRREDRQFHLALIEEDA